MTAVRTTGTARTGVLRVPLEPFHFVTGHPGSVPGVFHLRGGMGVQGACSFHRGHENRELGESNAPRITSPTEAPFGEKFSIIKLA